MDKLVALDPLAETGPADDAGETGLSFAQVLAAVRARWLALLLVPLLVGSAALGITFLLPPIYTANALIMPPQQGQGSAAAALASLGALSSLSGVGGAVRNSADQYIALMQSSTVSDRMVERFKLIERYSVEMRTDARRVLAKKARFAVGKKDGLITIEVDDVDPRTAADMANRYIDELRQMTATLAVTEAQQRRVFFQTQLEATRERLTKAQMALQGSGFSQGALNTEPRSAAEGYARMQAQVTAAEVRLQALRDGLSDDAPEVRQQRVLLGALRAQLAKMEAAGDTRQGADYVSRFRDFKYQETLFELYARQFELARVDESREGALIQIVDPAAPPERRSWPKRAMTAVLTTLVTGVLMLFFIVLRAPRRSGS